MIHNLQFVRELPNPDSVKALMPVPSEMKPLKEERDREVRAIFPLRSDRRDDLYPSLVCRDYTLAATQKTGV